MRLVNGCLFLASLWAGCAPLTTFGGNTALFTHTTTSLAAKDCRITPASKFGKLFNCPGVRKHDIVYSPRNDSQHYVVFLRHFQLKTSSRRLKQLVIDSLRFHNIGQQAEWRLRKGLFVNRPEAVIIPVSASDRNLELPNKIERGYLIVKITPDEVCVTDFIQSKTLLSGATLIDRARQAAAAARAKLCLAPDY